MTDQMGWAGRLMQWLTFAMYLVLLNLLFLAGTLAGLVVFGLFPAAVASTIMLERLRSGDPGDHLIRDFVIAYRSQFVHMNRVGSIFWAAAILVALNLTALPTPGSLVGPGGAVVTILFAVVSVVVAAAAASAVVICSRYRDTVRRTWRYAFVLPLVSPVMTISLLVCGAGIAVVFSGVGALVPLVGASLPLFVSGWLIGHRLDSLDPTAGAATEPTVGRPPVATAPASG